MNTIFALLIVAAIAVAIVLYRRAVPRRGVITLWKFTGYPIPVAPLGVYVPSLGRAPETIAEAELAGWYASGEAALASPPEVPVAPPFGGEPPAPGPRRLWQITGMAEGDKLLAGTWYRTLAGGYIDGGYTGDGQGPVPPSHPTGCVVLVDSRRKPNA